jgi:hypothetical protein
MSGGASNKGPGPPCASKGASSQDCVWPCCSAAELKHVRLGGLLDEGYASAHGGHADGPCAGRHSQCAGDGSRTRTPGSKVQPVGQSTPGRQGVVRGVLTIIQIEHQHPDARYPRVVAGGGGERARSAQSRRCEPAEAHSVRARPLATLSRSQGASCACLVEGYRRHTGPEFHTGGMRGSNASSYVICGKARQRHGPEFRHTRACGGSKPAGSVACIRAPKARLVFEEASLVHVLVEHIIVLLPHPLPAAPRRDEV